MSKNNQDFSGFVENSSNDDSHEGDRESGERSEYRVLASSRLRMLLAYQGYDKETILVLAGYIQGLLEFGVDSATSEQLESSVDEVQMLVETYSEEELYEMLNKQDNYVSVSTAMSNLLAKTRSRFAIYDEQTDTLTCVGSVLGDFFVDYLDQMGRINRVVHSNMMSFSQMIKADIRAKFDSKGTPGGSIAGLITLLTVEIFSDLKRKVQNKFLRADAQEDSLKAETPFSMNFYSNSSQAISPEMHELIVSRVVPNLGITRDAVDFTFLHHNVPHSSLHVRQYAVDQQEEFSCSSGKIEVVEKVLDGGDDEKDERIQSRHNEVVSSHIRVSSHGEPGDWVTRFGTAIVPDGDDFVDRDYHEEVYESLPKTADQAVYSALQKHGRLFKGERVMLLMDVFNKVSVEELNDRTGIVRVDPGMVASAFSIAGNIKKRDYTKMKEITSRWIFVMVDGLSRYTVAIPRKWFPKDSRLFEDKILDFGFVLGKSTVPHYRLLCSAWFVANFNRFTIEDRGNILVKGDDEVAFEASQLYEDHRNRSLPMKRAKNVYSTFDNLNSLMGNVHFMYPTSSKESFAPVSSYLTERGLQDDFEFADVLEDGNSEDGDLEGLDW